MNRSRSSIEPLESRIAPATLVNPTTVTYHDIDGDLVTVHFSQSLFTGPGALTTANAVLHFSIGNVVAVGTPDILNQQLQLIDLTGATGAHSGIGLTVTAKLAGLGDGFAAVGAIRADTLSVGAISIHGDLGSINAGTAWSSLVGVKSLTVQSIGAYGISTQETGGTLTSTFSRGVGALTVKSDIVGALINLPGGTEALLGSLTIGGSLIGTAADNSGQINANAIGPIKIAGNIAGGDGTGSGSIITTTTIKAVTIGGSLLGGTGSAGSSVSTGAILAGGNLGPVTIAGDINAGVYGDSGKVRSFGKITSLVVKGSILGGSGSQEATGVGTQYGQIIGLAGIGPITIGGDLRGSSGASSARIFAFGGNIDAIKVGGSVAGGSGANSGEIVALYGNIGDVTIAGSLLGGTATLTGFISANGTLGAVKIGGDVRGNTAQSSGGLEADGGPFKSLFIGGSLVGGSGLSSGYILASDRIGPVTILHSIFGGSGQFTGNIEADAGFGKVAIGGSIFGGSGFTSGAVVSYAGIGSITLGGSLVAGTLANAGSIQAVQDIDSLTIKGGVFGTSAHHALIAAAGISQGPATYVALKSVTIAGEVHFADIVAGKALNQTSGDAQIGAVKIGGDFIASSIAAGAAPGPNGYGTGDTILPGGDPAIHSAIAHITIAGQALGTVSGSDSYGIVAENIKALKVGGSTIPLTPGASNDNRLLGLTGDLHIHEI